MNYGIGDVVSCVSTDHDSELVVGRNYIVKGFHECDGVYVRVVGLNNNEDSRCAKCGTPRDGYFPHRFVKLDGLKETERVEDAVHA